MYFALLIITCLVNAGLILVSMYILIPEWLTIVGGLIISLLFILLLHKEKRLKIQVISSLISIISIVWGLYSAFCFPYWNSKTLRDISGEKFQTSLSQRSRMSSEEAEKDIIFCREKINRIHPLCRKGPDNKLELYFKEALDAVSSKDSVSVNELYLLLQKAAASLKDAHTRMYVVNKSLRIADYSNCDEILEFGNMPFDSLVMEKLPLVSSESYEWARYQIDSELRDADGILSLGFSLENGIDVKYLSDEIVQEGVFSEDSFKQRETVSHTMSADRIGGYTLSDSTKTVYLKIDNCYYYNLRSIRRFNKGIRKMFLEINERGISNLILDLRGNPGGNQAIVYEFFKYLPINKYRCGQVQMRRGPFMIKSNGVRRNKVNKDLCFKGKVYVLTSLQTFSAAMSFADMLQGNNLATVIGETPGNAATGCSNITHFVLPNSRLSLFVSTFHYDRVNDSVESIFVEPDIPCASSEAYKKAVEIISHGNEF